ncbi:MAG: UbiA-like polyprenyltransferase [Thermodesulfovibrionales bacterium]
MLEKIALYLRMIKFSHSVFALPFALTAVAIAAGGLPTAGQAFWVVAAMVGARSGAMGMNRFIDRKIDAMNPRTRGRELPSGRMRAMEVVLFSAASFGVMVLAAYMLNPLCLKLSPVAIAVIVFYSFTKRFTWLSHFVLGVALSAAPLGAWIAIRGTFDLEILPLALAVAFWLPGFDILYALQDMEFDRSHGLYSVPARFGVRRALALARVLHLLSWVLLALTGYVFGLGPVYWLGVLVAGGLFLYEHSLVRADDLSRLDMAFFNMNGYISVSVFLFTFVDRLIPFLKIPG